MKTVLITGGSSGIGYTISKKFAQNGYRIMWASLLEDELATAKAKLESLIDGVKIDTLAVDLSTEDGAQKVYDWAQSQNRVVDVLINNAGIGVFGYFHRNEMDKELNMLNLNVLNVFRMTKLFLQDMVPRDDGTIINIASNSAFTHVPKFSVYASTKAFVSHFSQCLQEEMVMQEKSVRIMVVCPAAISDTPFKKAAEMEYVKTFEGLAATTAEEVADDVWKAFKAKKTFVVSGRKMRFIYAIRNWIPARLQRRLVQDEVSERWDRE